jgi:hypothetical protein
MTNDFYRQVSERYCPRFGQIAVDKRFISEAQLQEALRCQADDDLRGHPHRLLGVILFDKEWMNSEQIEQVLTVLFKSMRQRDE